MEETDIPNALRVLRKKVEEAKFLRRETESEVCVIAVSKTKPKSMIIEAYSYGQRDFGENYVNELVEKASDPEILELCPEIKWHFIGHLQSNKVNKLVGVPGLYMVHTIDSVKLADLTDKAWVKLQKPERLRIMIQVNTSSEDNKSGITPDEVENIAKHIIEKCSNLSLSGFMLIGYANHDLKIGPNPEFQMLSMFRDVICGKFSIDPLSLGLSMGMSQDFEHAIELGSNYIRVGSSIFGARS